MPTLPAPTVRPGPSGFTPGTAANPRPIFLLASDTGTYAPNVVYLAEGETVTFEVTNTGTKDHGFTIGPASDVYIEPPTSPASATIPAGATGHVTFTVTGIGPFAFASHAAGDLAAGQVGYVIVVGPHVPGVGTDARPRLVALIAGTAGFNRPTVPAFTGETVTFLVSNTASEAREFLVGPKDKVAAIAIDQVTVVTTGPIPPGQVRPITYTFPAAGGSYGYGWHTPGASTLDASGTITFP